MSHVLRAALIGAALLTSTSAVFALEGIDGDGNPVPGAYPGSYGYASDAPYAQMGPGVPLRAPTRAERRALSRGYEVR